MWHNVYFAVPAILLFAAASYASHTKNLVKRVPQVKGLPGRGLPLLDTAFLSGGPGRVFDTALVRMHQAGRVVVNRAGLVTLTTERAYDAVDLAIIEAVGPTGQRDLTSLRRAVMRAPAVQELGDGLANRGLLRNPTLLRRAKVARRLLWLALLLTVVTIAAAYLVDRGEADRPSLWLPPVLVLFGLVSLLVTWPFKGRITPAGRRQLALMSVGKPWTPSAGLAPRAAGGALIGAIALGGLAASGLDDAELQEALLAAAAADLVTARSAMAGGSSSSSATSSATSCSSAGTSCGGVTWCGSGSGSDSGSSGSSCGGSSCGSSSSSCGSSSSSSCGSGSSSCGSSSSCGGGSSCGS
ncbi:TIGR04222 domain-containing membrane protein [Kitasatospora sp. NPDC091207]|uniref:TIGR04222 domain-containing membrane protein n=1 Tax=Kitasatospora sp. NPDC091207 TaxID=3364083 RepID=UPI00381E8666